MATGKVEVLKKAFRFLFNRKVINKMARESGIQMRKRKVEPYRLIMALVMGFASGKSKTLEDIRRCYCLAARDNLAKSSFYDHLTRKLAEFLGAMVGDLCKRDNCAKDLVGGDLSLFRDVLIQDATVITLDDKLEMDYPSSKRAGSKLSPSMAALKVHLAFSPLAENPSLVKITPETDYDGDHLVIDESIKDRLLLFDRGYYRYTNFYEIINEGGFFITRSQKRFNAPITADNLKPSVDVSGETSETSTDIGKKLKAVVQNAVDNGNTSPLDYQVEIFYRFKEAREKYGSIRFSLRFVGVWDPKAKRYSTYLTNIPADKMSAQEIARMYGCRWDVEMRMLELKSYFKIDHIKTGNEDIVEILVYSAILSWILCRTSKFALHEINGLSPGSCPFVRFASVFFSAARDIHDLLVNRRKYITWEQGIDYLIHEMRDPCVNRKRNIADVWSN